MCIPDIRSFSADATPGVTIRRTLLGGLAVAGLVACDKGKPGSTADASRVLESGIRIEATTDRTISSRDDKAGETFTASVSSDVTDGRGRVVIPAGSTLNLSITQLQSATDKGKATGRITVRVSSVTVAARRIPFRHDHLDGALPEGTRGRYHRGGEEAAGVVLGGVAGRVIGGDANGTVIGAVVGGAVGAAVAVEPANRDVVVVAGTPVVVTLNEPLTLAVR